MPNTNRKALLFGYVVVPAPTEVQNFFSAAQPCPHGYYKCSECAEKSSLKNICVAVDKSHFKKHDYVAELSGLVLSV